MIDPQVASQLTVRTVLLNSKMVPAALMGGLVVITIVLIVVSTTIIGQGVLQNEPVVEMLLLVIGVAVGLILLLAGYFLPNVICSSAERQALSGGRPSLVQPGSDLETLEQAFAPLDKDTRGQLLSSYLSRVMVRFALMEAAGMINSIFYFLTGSMVHLALVVATLIAMVMLFPTFEKMRQWVESLQAT